MFRSMLRIVFASLLVALGLSTTQARAQQIPPDQHRALSDEAAQLRNQVADLLLGTTYPVTGSAEQAARDAVFWTPNAALEPASWRLKKAAEVSRLIASLKEGKSPTLKQVNLTTPLITELDRVTGTLVIDLISPDEDSHAAAAKKVAFVYDTVMLILATAVNSTATPLDVTQPTLVSPGGGPIMPIVKTKGAVKLLDVTAGTTSTMPNFVPSGQPTRTTTPPAAGFIPPPAPRIPGERRLGN